MLLKATRLGFGVTWRNSERIKKQSQERRASTALCRTATLNLSGTLRPSGVHRSTKAFTGVCSKGRHLAREQLFPSPSTHRREQRCAMRWSVDLKSSQQGDGSALQRPLVWFSCSCFDQAEPQGHTLSVDRASARG